MYGFFDDENLGSLPQNLADQARAFISAATAIDGGASSASSSGASSRGKTGDVAEWARQQAKLISDETLAAFPMVSNSTSEHEVRYRLEDHSAVKRTWAGVYGQIPVAQGGKLDRKNALPAEYLYRMALHIAVFGSDLRLEGVNISDRPSMIIGHPPSEPAFVISQPWYEKTGRATNEEIEDYLKEEGFVSVPKAYYGWYRPNDGVVIVDAKPDNFIKTTFGLVPIDLQMARFTSEELSQAGLSS